MSIGQQNKYRMHNFSGSLFMVAHVRWKTFLFLWIAPPCESLMLCVGVVKAAPIAKALSQPALLRFPALQPLPSLFTFSPSVRNLSVPKLKKLRFNNWFMLLSAPFFWRFFGPVLKPYVSPLLVHVAPLCHPLSHLYYYKSDKYPCLRPGGSSSSKFVRRRYFFSIPV